MPGPYPNQYYPYLPLIQNRQPCLPLIQTSISHACLLSKPLSSMPTSYPGQCEPCLTLLTGPVSAMSESHPGQYQSCLFLFQAIITHLLLLFKHPAYYPDYYQPRLPLIQAIISQVWLSSTAVSAMPAPCPGQYRIRYFTMAPRVRIGR
jgi:hypothetical protein